MNTLQEPLAPGELEPAAPVAVARHPILDRKKAIFGYELVDASGAPGGPAQDAALLLQALTLSEHQATAERRVLIVPCHLETAASGHLDLVDPSRIVLAVELPRAAGAATTESATWAEDLQA
ncbi:hypothetical protein [Ramlibacter rhizophilus]|uniref:Uncharacterized protein n=1 Tax=Ramlibacter rhizophilus TaxID=1781167 RepID=A0A4Z0BHH0_9BURK|nr:hypothetical protein [Ramlibacter rhizophilus]TFY98742.1 hypothetical protein EZ242_14590 [Ramlibacter rhizophilus]